MDDAVCPVLSGVFSGRGLLLCLDRYLPYLPYIGTFNFTIYGISWRTWIVPKQIRFLKTLALYKHLCKKWSMLIFCVGLPKKSIFFIKFLFPFLIESDLPRLIPKSRVVSSFWTGFELLLDLGNFSWSIFNGPKTFLISLPRSLLPETATRVKPRSVDSGLYIRI